MNIIFNRDIIINESEVITDAQASVGILDDQTIRENHPWYNKDVEDRLKKQKSLEQQQEDEYREAFEKQQSVIADEQ